jgi:cytidylate kinase
MLDYFFNILSYRKKYFLFQLLYLLPMRKIIIAIDGYSGCGKSSTAMAVAKELGYKFIDTGAMYRATTLYFLDNYVSITDPKAIKKALEEIEITFVFSEKDQCSHTFLNGVNVEKAIRTMRVNEMVSPVAAIKEVRQEMVAQQKKMGKSKGIVMDGRDIGTNVFPEAELKLFVTAAMDVRVHRRQQELLDKKITASLEEIEANFRERDHIDSTRKENPLTQAEDAIVLDTTSLSFDAQVQFVMEHYKETISKLAN